MHVKRFELGPGLIVAAAFVGPGTVTTATLAGANFGLTLLWCLVFATVAAIVLQEMSARLGLSSGGGLSGVLRNWGPAGPVLAWVSAAAVVVGAAAFQAGNLTGAALGLRALTGVSPEIFVPAVALIAGVLLWTGHYRLTERVLMGCVALMGVAFVATAAVVMPSLATLLEGAFIPRVPGGAEWTAVALIGTTIVPYNLFLHAAVVRERWSSVSFLSSARRDLTLAIAAGGVISASIVVTAGAALEHVEVTSASDMAEQLEPLLGQWARVVFAVGFALAGVTSAITAPLAATYVALDTAALPRDMRSPVARGVWLTCVAVGGGFALAGFEPVLLILFAQAANGLILPLVAIALLAALNDRARLGSLANGWVGNVAAAVAVTVCVALGLRALMQAIAGA